MKSKLWKTAINLIAVAAILSLLALLWLLFTSSREYWVPGQKEGFVQAQPLIPSAEASPDMPSLPQFAPPGPERVKSYVRAQSLAKGVNPAKTDWLVSHESQYQDRDGDDGQSRGYFQISRIYHPEVSDACAHDLKCSTEWSLNYILTGHIGEWSTIKYCRKLYQDCPF